MYADFRTDPDKAFDLIDRSLAKISNPTMTRLESPDFHTDFHTDFSIDWKESDHPQTEETWVIRLTFVDHSEKFPYVVVSEFKVYEIGEISYFADGMEEKAAMDFARALLKKAVIETKKNPLLGLLSDNSPQYVAWETSLGQNIKAAIIYSYRRMGIDNGMDTAVHLGNNLEKAQEHIEKTLAGS